MFRGFSFSSISGISSSGSCDALYSHDLIRTPDGVHNYNLAFFPRYVDSCWFGPSLLTIIPYTEKVKPNSERKANVKLWNAKPERFEPIDLPNSASKGLLSDSCNASREHTAIRS